MGDLSRVSGRHCEAADVLISLMDFLRFYQTFSLTEIFRIIQKTLFLEISIVKPQISPGVLSATSVT